MLLYYFKLVITSENILTLYDLKYNIMQLPDCLDYEIIILIMPEDNLSTFLYE